MIENKTVIGEKQVKALNGATSKIEIILASAIIIIAFGIVGVIFAEDGSKKIAYLWLGLGVLYLILVVFMKINVKKNIKSNKNISESSIMTYCFNEDNVEFCLKVSGEVCEEGVLKYQNIYKVIENADYFFLFVANNAAQIVDKKGFTPEDSLELRNRLRSYILPKKYKLSRKARK